MSLGGITTYAHAAWVCMADRHGAPFLPGDTAQYKQIGKYINYSSAPFQKARDRRRELEVRCCCHQRRMAPSMDLDVAEGGVEQLRPQQVSRIVTPATELGVIL